MGFTWGFEQVSALAAWYPWCQSDPSTTQVRGLPAPWSVTGPRSVTGSPGYRLPGLVSSLGSLRRITTNWQLVDNSQTRLSLAGRCRHRLPASYQPSSYQVAGDTQYAIQLPRFYHPKPKPRPKLFGHSMPGHSAALHAPSPRVGPPGTCNGCTNYEHIVEKVLDLMDFACSTQPIGVKKHRCLRSWQGSRDSRVNMKLDTTMCHHDVLSLPGTFFPKTLCNHIKCITLLSEFRA